MTASAAPAEAGPDRERNRPTRDRDLASELDRAIDGILARRPAVGLAIGVARRGQVELRGRGLARVASPTPVTDATVFRIGSITKTFTAIAVMQEVEAGRVELDAPASAYLRAYRLVTNGFGQPTIRHLLSHRAGIPDVRRLSDLLHAGFTPDDGRPPHLSVPFGERLPSLAEYYRDGLRVVAEPGRFFAYSNHGFATLGQIVENVSGQPLERVLRDRIFDPLGMAASDLVRSDRVAGRLATGYTVTGAGVTTVEDRDWIGRGSGGAYSTVGDLLRYAAALLAGGSNGHGAVLRPTTLAEMFDRQYPPDPRVSGVGLGFFRANVGGHRVVHHDGILPGFNSALVVAPDDGIAIVAMTNGSPGAFGWLAVELEQLLRRLLDLPEEEVRPELPYHPETWGSLRGRYVVPPVADLRQRLVLGGGADVIVRGGRLRLRVALPVAGLLRGLPLDPADPADPDVLRLDLAGYGMGSVRVVFARGRDGRVERVHTDLGGQPWTLIPDPGPGRRWPWRVAAGVAAFGAAGLAVRRRRRGTRA
jgi:CubicO group peptidase (beta-lactamase class C family)